MAAPSGGNFFMSTNRFLGFKDNVETEAGRQRIINSIDKESAVISAVEKTAPATDTRRTKDGFGGCARVRPLTRPV
jgi:hypothetical protein